MTISDYPPAGGCDHTLTDDGGGFFCAGSWGHAIGSMVFAVEHRGTMVPGEVVRGELES